jgi:hypothetical protein
LAVYDVKNRAKKRQPGLSQQVQLALIGGGAAVLVAIIQLIGVLLHN